MEARKPAQSKINEFAELLVQTRIRNALLVEITVRQAASQMRAELLRERTEDKP